jgi:prepilin-type N-terminal cleavage/methylation domain-containing protein/prepilin-type processing-associated H-X9-DG protein
MSSRKIRTKAFTLIELLVVIAIIALLLSILSPSLRKVKMQVKTLVCTINCRSLSTAWSAYALDYDGMIVSSMTGYSDYWTHLSMVPLVCPNPWVDWAGYPDYDDPADIELQIQTVERGVLFPYVETIKAYRCPLSKKGQVKCYSIPDFFGNEEINGHISMGGQEALVKTGQIRMPSERIIFLDEDDISYGGFTIYYDRAEWWDWPPSRHDDGITLGYADGHADYYKWREKDTLDLTRKIREDPDSVTVGDLSQPGNKDIFMIQRRIFGELGYSP